MKSQRKQNDDRETIELKQRIYAQLKEYRKNNGLGCFKTISEASNSKLAIGTIAHMYTGTKVDIDIWILVGEVLEKLNRETAGN